MEEKEAIVLALVHLRGVVHVYDGRQHRFVRKNAGNVAEALGEKDTRTLHHLLAYAEWIAEDEGRQRHTALRRDENRQRNR